MRQIAPHTRWVKGASRTARLPVALLIRFETRIGFAGVKFYFRRPARAGAPAAGAPLSGRAARTAREAARH